jgi:hypothetical protein
MLMTRERRPAYRTLEGSARSVLLEAGAIRECEEHGWMQDCADPHARERAFALAQQGPPPSVSSAAAAAANRRGARFDWRYLPGVPTGLIAPAAISRRPTLAMECSSLESL